MSGEKVRQVNIQIHINRNYRYRSVLSHEKVEHVLPHDEACEGTYEQTDEEINYFWLPTTLAVALYTKTAWSRI